MVPASFDFCLANLNCEKPDALQVAGHSEQVIAVRRTLNGEIGKPVKELGEVPTIVLLDRSGRE